MSKTTAPPDANDLVAIFNELVTATAGTEFPPGRRVQLAVASLCIVRDHHLAIAILVSEKLYASAFALMRPLYEAAVKGMWFVHCAPDTQLEAFAEKKELKDVGILADDLLRSPLPPLVATQLRRIKDMYWKVMSSFSHAGHAQLKRWLSLNGVESTYSDAELAEVINFTAFVAVVSALEFARLGANQAALGSISTLLPEDWEIPMQPAAR